MTNDELIERLEAATKDNADLILEAFRAIKPNYADDRAIRAMLDAEAYESAALTLVPEGAVYAIETNDGPGVYPEHVRASAWVQGAARAFAATPALAIVIAAVKAKEADNG